MTDTIDIVAERLLREAARSLTSPASGECLPCFVARMLDTFGCDTTLRFARRFRDLVAPRAVALERRLGRAGGFCDCEILLNGWWLHERLWTPEHAIATGGDVLLVEAEPPPEVPPCTGVRAGSTQPCRNWQRRRRGWW